VPPDAEVLVQEGQAPLDIDDVPVGMQSVFVATAAGFAPKRATIAADADWASGPDGKLQLDLSISLDKSRVSPPGADRWPPFDAGVEVGGTAPHGRLHVVVAPAGAQVWLRAGAGREVTIEGLPCGRDVDLLIAGPTSYRQRLHVWESQFVNADRPALDGTPARTATVSIEGQGTRSSRSP
jgi:hypothetical protein